MRDKALKTLLKRMGANLKAARHRKGLTVIETESQSGVHRATIFRLEGGYILSPRLETLLRLCQTYDISIEEIFQRGSKASVPPPLTVVPVRQAL